MNISKYIKSLSLGAILLTATLSLGSCSKQDKDVFHADANTRVDESIVALRKQLVSAEHGWIMEYYPHRHRNYGGFVLGMKFDDKGNVLISSERDNDLKGNKLEASIRSMYDLGADRSVTLNFSTYNPHIHDLGDPGTPQGGGYSRGYEGDHEFMLLDSDNPDIIKLKGKKTQNTIYMHRATESIASYLSKIRNIRELMYTSPVLSKEHMEALEGTLGGEKVDLTPSEDNYNYFNIARKDGAVEKIPYIVTPQGLRFYKPEKGVAELRWNEADKSFTSAQGDKLIARADPIYPKYAEYLGAYIFSYGNNGEHQFDVRFEEDGRNRYVIKGDKLPFAIKALYDVEHDRFEIRTQPLSDGKGNMYTWEPVSGYFATDKTVGLYSKIVENSNPKQYIMVDNGKWGQRIATSYALWNDKTRWVQYSGVSPELIKPKFTRKN